MTWCNVHLSGRWSNGVSGHCSGDPADETIQNCSGFFAVVRQDEHSIFAAVDRVRSIPLFYAWHHGQFYLSDDAHWVRDEIGSSEVDPTCRDEFLLTGYVTGADTLFPGVWQLQAGECLTARRESVRLRRYYRFLHSEGPADHLAERFDAAMFAATDRLIEHAAGCQIVIPLSGGYDSRLVLAGLIRRGYDNLLCFTYGASDNVEVGISRAIADAVGVRWLFTPYTPDAWRSVFASNDRLTYYRMASGLCSLPHMQDFLAVRDLRGSFALDCIVAPGHTGDFICGGHLPAKAAPGQHVTPDDLTEAVISRHYCLHRGREQGFRLANPNRIYDRAESGPADTPVALAEAYEKWEWQERQAKYIVNSVRVYDYMRLDWWLTLWDGAFMDFWSSVPLAIRSDKNWYPAQVDRFCREAGIEVGTRTERSGLRHHLMVSAIRAGQRGSRAIPAISNTIQRAKNVFSARRDLRNPMMLGHAPYDRPKTAMKLAAGQRILGLYAEDFIASLSTSPRSGEGNRSP